jgi:hypothetical protein
MKKSTLSIASLILGIITTCLGAVLLPLSMIVTGVGGATVAGFIALTALFLGFIGTVCGVTKIVIGHDNVPPTALDEQNKAIAIKGLWFSAVPFAILSFLMILGSTMK